jgi:hypothetical protein
MMIPRGLRQHHPFTVDLMYGHADSLYTAVDHFFYSLPREAPGEMIPRTSIGNSSSLTVCNTKTQKTNRKIS